MNPSPSWPDFASNASLQHPNRSRLRISSLHQRPYHNDIPYPHTPIPPPTPPSPISLPESPALCLALYFGFNLGLTLYNKGVLVRFPFPYTLSAVHALCGTIGSTILVRVGVFTPASLSGRETAILVAFSALYTLNIVVSNVSLELVTVPFHQVVRASTPLFTIFFSAILLGAKSSRAKLVSLIPVVAGVGLATYGDYSFTRWGFLLTLLGTLLAALKTILTNVLQRPASPPHISLTIPPSRPSFRGALDSKTIPSSDYTPNHTTSTLPTLTPLHLLHLLSPLAFIQTTLLAHFSGELDRVRGFAFPLPLPHFPSPSFPSFHSSFSSSPYAAAAPPSSSSVMMSGDHWHWQHTLPMLLLLLLNGVMAFGLNVVSFSANRRIGPLGMSVAANVKQALTILCAVSLFDLRIAPANALGIFCTLAGGAWYAAVEYREHRRRRRKRGVYSG